MPLNKSNGKVRTSRPDQRLCLACRERSAEIYTFRDPLAKGEPDKCSAFPALLNTPKTVTRSSLRVSFVTRFRERE
jgi:hypothetical protein